MDFKEAYKLPLKMQHGMVFTANGQRAFDFTYAWRREDGYFVNEATQEAIIDLINGRKGRFSEDLKLSYKDSYIYTSITGEPKEFISIRGWGMLTGTGGLRLPDEEAVKIQDDFAMYIIDALSSQRSIAMKNVSTTQKIKFYATFSASYLLAIPYLFILGLLRGLHIGAEWAYRKWLNLFN